MLAVPLHLGIALAMGMMTFGLVMLIANLAFVSPSIITGVFALQEKTDPPVPGKGQTRRRRRERKEIQR